MQETENGSYFSWGNTDGYAGDSGHNFGSVDDFDDQTQTWGGIYGTTTGGSLTDSFTPGGADDAARVMLGEPWKMPTLADFQELIDPNNCTHEWVTDYQGSGKNGILFTSLANGKTLFLPAAGYIEETTLQNEGNGGDYWCATLATEVLSNSLTGYNLFIGIGGGERCLGYPVRAVKSPS